MDGIFKRVGLTRNNKGINQTGIEQYELYAQNLPPYCTDVYDELHNKLLEANEELKQRKYEVIFFCDHSAHLPSMPWVLNRYYSLDYGFNIPN
jgi:hypothetical protein